MGWTYGHATRYKANGKVDFKAECDALLQDDIYEIVRSQMVGSVYYAAVRTTKRRVVDPDGNFIKDAQGNYVREDVPFWEQEIWAAIFKTGSDGPYWNFGYKDMDETVGPCECDCPKSILDLLTPTDNEIANMWRERCYRRLEDKKHKRSFNDLPYGTRIRYTTLDGRVMTLTKHEPSFQFKTWFWYNEDSNKYMPKSHVRPESAEILREEVTV